MFRRSTADRVEVGESLPFGPGRAAGGVRGRTSTANPVSGFSGGGLLIDRDSGDAGDGDWFTSLGGELSLANRVEVLPVEGGGVGEHLA